MRGHHLLPRIARGAAGVAGQRLQKHSLDRRAPGVLAHLDAVGQQPAAVTFRDIATYPTEKIVRTTVAKANPAGVPMPLP